MKGKEFDYEKAWEKVALEEFKKLSPMVYLLLGATQALDPSLVQGPNLDMPWQDDPQGKWFRSQFERIPSLELAKAAHTIYALGHWFPATKEAKQLLANFVQSLSLKEGAHWKFANYADQILRIRLGLPEVTTIDGIHFRVHQGVLRVCWSHRTGWQWTEIGWATEENQKRAGNVVPSGTPKLSYTKNPPYQTWDDYVTALEEVCGGDGYEIWDMSRFMITVLR